MASPARTTVTPLTAEDRLARAQQNAREIERFAMGAVDRAETEDDVRQARTILQIATGLRRKLEAWR